MLVNNKIFNFCCNILGKDIINSKFFSYYDKLKLIARCSFENILLIPDLFEKFYYTYFNPVDSTFIYVATANYENFLNKYLNLTVLIGILLSLMAVYLPVFQNLLRTISLSFSEWLIIFVFGIINLVIFESVKYVSKKKRESLIEA